MWKRGKGRREDKVEIWNRVWNMSSDAVNIKECSYYDRGKRERIIMCEP